MLLVLWVKYAERNLYPSDANNSKRASFVRHHLEEHGMPVEDAPEDEDVRQTYNFAPGSHGLVYRADVPDYGAGNRSQHQDEDEHQEDEPCVQLDDSTKIKYKLQAMNWGIKSQPRQLVIFMSFGLTAFDRTYSLLD